MKFEPCVLCWYQRIFMYPFVLWLGIAVAKRLSHRKLFFTNCKYWCLYFFISLCNSKVSVFSCWSSCGRVPCTGEFINWFGFITIPFLALIGFITIAVCSFIVIKTNKEMKEWKNAYIWWYYYRLVRSNFRCHTNGRKMLLAKRLIILLKVRQTVLTTTQIKSLFQIFKRT